MLSITRRLEFDAGHRVLGHEGKCAHLHGHRYRADVEVTAPALDRLGRVIDFSMVKMLVGGWIDDNWDHNILLHPNDPLLQCPGEVFGPKTPFVMEGNPTAENMARELFYISRNLLTDHGLEVVSITMYETPNCWAVYRP